MIGLDDIIVCTEFLNVKDTFTYNPHFEQGSHEIVMTFCLPEKSLVESKVSEYHLIFDLNGVLVTTREGPTKSWPMILRPRLREFLSSCATKFTMYIWSFVMWKFFSKYLEIIRERTCVHVEFSKIVDQKLCFKMSISSLKSPKSLFCIKTVKHIFGCLSSYEL
jgi:hypothetical protein